MNYLWIHVATHRAGTHGYYADRQRGTIDVWHDSMRYVYRKPNRDVPNIMVKRDILSAFEAQGEICRMTGQFPNYRIETQANSTAAKPSA